MAVYTVLEQQDLEAAIKPFGIGPLVDYQGAADGIENTTYFLSTDHRHLLTEELTADTQHYVLTIFEELSAEDLSYYVALTQALAEAGLPVPAPLRDYHGNTIQTLEGKPALLFPKAAGSHPRRVNRQHCTTLGTTLGRMHQVSQALDIYSEGNRSFRWLKHSADKIQPFLEPSDQGLLHHEISSYETLLTNHPGLPVGIIHNDLFRDNTLFVGDELTAIIDFYNACNGFLLLDVAITVNDWCSREDGSLDEELYLAFIHAYHEQRPFMPQEREHWDRILRICATRFWVSRLLARHLPQTEHRKGGLVQHKDPNHYRQILIQRVRYSPPLPGDRVR